MSDMHNDEILELTRLVDPSCSEGKIADDILCQFSVERIESIVAETARVIIGNMAERIVTDVAEKAVREEIDKIKSAL
ncbi:MAG: hypothetical protein V1753_03770 [Pseudomonadota bacterium]